MNSAIIISNIGGLLVLLAMSMLLPLAIAGYYGDIAEVKAFLYCAFISGGVGGVMKFLSRGGEAELTIREGFVTVVLGWAVCVFFGALPYWFTGSLNDFTDAYFESMSGFTTTGASVIGDVESLPRGILSWRSLTQWLGGLGIVVFFIAFLPTTGLGAYRLFRIEIPGGPFTDRVRPRIVETARLLLQIYTLLSLSEFFLLYLGGMSAFDALCHTFSTVSTGGFSTRNASIGAYHSPYLEGVVSLFMFLSACNFVLHYQLIRGNVRQVLMDVELRFFTSLLVVVTLIVALSLYLSGAAGEGSFLGCIGAAAFQVASITTTTGFTTSNFDAWPEFCRFLLVSMMFFGGCVGSTAGGIKNIRILLLAKATGREFVRLTAPRVVKHVKVYGASVEEEVITNTFGFFVLYLGLFGLFCLILTSLGTEIVTAFSAVAATMGNVGPGLGGVGAAANYGHLGYTEKWVLIFCMLLGRLEIYSVIFMFLLWRR